MFLKYFIQNDFSRSFGIDGTSSQIANLTIVRRAVDDNLSFLRSVSISANGVLSGKIVLVYSQTAEVDPVILAVPSSSSSYLL